MTIKKYKTAIRQMIKKHMSYIFNKSPNNPTNIPEATYIYHQPFKFLCPTFSNENSGKKYYFNSMIDSSSIEINPIKISN